MLAYSEIALGQDAELDALDVANSASALMLGAEQATTDPRRSDLAASVEPAANVFQTADDPGALDASERASLDVRYAPVLPAARLRFGLSDRLDLRHGAGAQASVNTLREAFASWDAPGDASLDAGRVNVRNGVGAGYNPTDYFRSGALRSVTTSDPDSLRENRQGTVIVGGQKLWNGGSASALFSPRIERNGNTGSFNPNFGATNSTDRWLVKTSARVWDGFAPELLAFKEAGESAQAGINATALFNNATVGHVEFSGGRAPSLLDQALGRSDDTAFRYRLAAGATYTTEGRLSLTLEYQYNGAGLETRSWDALRNGPPPAYGAYRRWIAVAQDPPTRRQAFAFLRKPDVLIPKLDLSMMLRMDASDLSMLGWMELRYHWKRTDLALQVQGTRGNATSNYGALPQKRLAQLTATLFV
ncbi:hypothetical protein [Caballeronia telluris]|uniref:Uncharacterized protein n=1 Tax=Caballeronia telluris TaxID=326475 RepID=A0A158G539_9BURK|nr:hypothetical protein [Caballeronia telluris]SAL26530.1 hypothetical protein AWB66_01548 [Caballeronia telluris]